MKKKLSILATIILTAAFSLKEKPLEIYAIRNSNNSIERVFRYESNAVNYVEYYKNSHDYIVEKISLVE